MAGTLFGDVEGWLLLLCALYWTFHVCHSCCSGIVLGVSCVPRINRESHFPWQEHYLVMLEGDSCCPAHCTGRFMCDADQP